MDEENPPTTEAQPMVASEEEGSGTQSDSDTTLAGLEPLEELLAHPTLNPWYKNGSLFPSIPADVRLPLVDWEWLVKREDTTADAIWVPPFQEILDLKIKKNDILVVPLKFDFQCFRANSWEAWVDKEFFDEAFCAHLERAGVLQAILISRSSNM